MADEKAAGNYSANKGASKNNRRRAVRSKRRGRKPDESSDARTESGAEAQTAPRTTRVQPSAAKAGADKGVRDQRERRRRRRVRAKQRGSGESAAPAQEESLKDLPPLVPAFVYTHVVRPSMRDSFEFRTEHFSKVTRRLEDFHIDLSPLYPDGGDEIKGVAWMPPLDHSAFADDEDDEEDFGDAGEGDAGEGDSGGEDSTAHDQAVQNRVRQAGNDEEVSSDRTKPRTSGSASDARAARRARRQAKRNAGAHGHGSESANADDETGGEAGAAHPDAEIYDNPDWDAEESADAARLDGVDLAEGALADDFYAEMDDSVVDEYPEEDLDD